MAAGPSTRNGTFSASNGGASSSDNTVDMAEDDSRMGSASDRSGRIGGGPGGGAKKQAGGGGGDDDDDDDDGMGEGDDNDNAASRDGGATPGPGGPGEVPQPDLGTVRPVPRAPLALLKNCLRVCCGTAAPAGGGGGLCLRGRRAHRGSRLMYVCLAEAVHGGGWRPGSPLCRTSTTPYCCSCSWPAPLRPLCTLLGLPGAGCQPPAPPPTPPTCQQRQRGPANTHGHARIQQRHAQRGPVCACSGRGGSRRR